MVTAALWGFFAGMALLVGAAVALILPVPNRVVGAVMGFGSGVLFSAVAFELTEEAIADSGLLVVTCALLAGALVYIAGDWAVSEAGAHRRKSPLHGGTDRRTHRLLHADLHRQRAVATTAPQVSAPAPAPPARAATPAAAALVIGTLLDGIPESAAIGVSLLAGEGVGLAFVAAVFLSNIPEGIGATVGLRASGHRRRGILLLWLGIALASGAAAGLGYAVLGAAGPTLLGGIQAFAAGGVLAMLATTMLPEAVDHAGRLVGLVTVVGFAAAVLLGAL